MSYFLPNYSIFEHFHFSRISMFFGTLSCQ